MAHVLAAGADPVMAALAIAVDPGMGEVCNLPVVGRVADIAGLERQDMGRGLAGGADPVVAGLAAAADHAGVVEKDQLPALGDVAGIAGFVGGNMAGMLARRDIAVMAAFTGAGHLGVIDMAYPPPAEGGVAELAGVAREDVIAALALCGTAVVAGKTVTRYRAVIEPGDMPSHRGMAIIALVIAADMVHRLARGIGIVMTTVTQQGSAREASIDVALIALDVFVFACQRKAGGEVIVVGGYSQCLIREESAKYCQKQHQPRELE